MAVDLPAPFSPTMAWIVPGSTRRLTRSLATTSPKRLVILRSSIMGAARSWGRGRHGVGHLDLAADDLLPGGLDLPDHLRGDQLRVVLVDRVADAVVVEAVHVDAALEAVADPVAHDLVDGVVDALDHAGEHVAGLDPVLVRVDADDELAALLGGVEGAEPRVAGRGEDHVRALADLSDRQLLALARVVPCRIGHPDVVLDDADARVHRPRALFV